MTRPIPTTATRDELCEWCAFPFGIGDDCYTNQYQDAVYCSKRCMRDHSASLSEAERMAAADRTVAL